MAVVGGCSSGLQRHSDRWLQVFQVPSHGWRAVCSVKIGKFVPLGLAVIRVFDLGNARLSRGDWRDMTRVIDDVLTLSLQEPSASSRFLRWCRSAMDDSDLLLNGQVVSTW